ncbi:hypothetical protein KAJ02_04050, partial [Candidatus Bipolaricaulota bacterium]|nr:hypothetical protein [Candidatus Bipolaricaulota bacterium]
GYQYDDQQIADCVSGVELLETFLGESTRPKTIEFAIAEDVPAFSANLIAQNLNVRNRFVGLYRYAGMIKNYALQVGVLELLDGFEILGNLHRQIGEELGEETQAAIFEGVELPVLGTTPREWTRVNAVVFPRLEEATDPDTVKRILRSGLRNLSEDRYLPSKERYEEFADIDAFLEDRGKRHLDNLIKQRDEGTPYFNQFINDDVIDFVRATPEIGGGVRQGQTIVEIKIPHQSIEYLAATEIAKKQYHVCHCPLIKESILRDDLTISPAFCDFCPSFNAKPWEVIFGRKLKYEVLESGLRGGVWCKFAIHLPEGTA